MPPPLCMKRFHWKIGSLVTVNGIMPIWDKRYCYRHLLSAAILPLVSAHPYMHRNTQIQRWHQLCMSVNITGHFPHTVSLYKTQHDHVHGEAPKPKRYDSLTHNAVQTLLSRGFCFVLFFFLIRLRRKHTVRGISWIGNVAQRKL